MCCKWMLNFGDRVDFLNPTLTRPGRFDGDGQIQVDPPDLEGRKVGYFQGSFEGDPSRK
jgi:ATP-dependent 26S proteasome regulatory subunit